MMSFFNNLDTEMGLFLLTALILIFAVLTFIVIVKQRNKPKPIITVDMEDGVLKYKNIGDESAIKIQTEEVSLNIFSIFFPIVNLLEPSHKKKFEYNIKGRNRKSEYLLGATKDLNKELFPFFEELQVHWYTLVTHFENVKGKRYMSVVLVRCKTKKIEHKLYGRKWWIEILDKLGLIRKLPKPPKDAHLYME